MAIAAVNIVIVALAFTSIWPFPHGDFKVDLPSASEITWSYSDGIVHVTAPYSIDNGGFYDVSNLTLHYAVTNYSGYPLADQTIPIGDVPAGRITSSSIDFRFDLLRLFKDGALGMVFSDDLLKFAMDVSCSYTMKLVKFEASYQVNVPWDALIQGWGVASIHYPSTLPSPGNPISVDVTYWLQTSDILSGLPPAQVTVNFFGNSTMLGQAQGTVQLGTNYSDTVTLSVTPAYYTSYFVELVVHVAGFSFNETYPAPSLPMVIP
jgi:hypothetical protein